MKVKCNGAQMCRLSFPDAHERSALFRIQTPEQAGEGEAVTAAAGEVKP